MTPTPEEARRVHVLTGWNASASPLCRAQMHWPSPPPQVRPLRVVLHREGPAVLVHGNRNRRSSRRLPDALMTHFVTLARGWNASLNDLHLTEKPTTV